MSPDSFDVQRARRETPGAGRVVHLNNAGAALVPEPVLDACVGHLHREAVTGGYEAAEEADEKLRGTYRAIARLLGCRPAEVALTSSATRAWDMAFYSLDFSAGDRILTSRASYASNYLAFLQVARRTGARVEVVESDPEGALDVDDLEHRLEDDVRLVALTHVPTNGGLVNPAAAVGARTREAGVPFLLDACQSAGQIPLAVEDLGCDFLAATSRKYLRGPRGMGFLYVRREVAEALEPPLVDLHSAEWVSPDRYELRPGARRFEQWERNYAGQLGLKAAVEYALGWGLAEIRDRVVALAAELRSRLGELEGVTVRDLGRVRCGIVTFQPAGMEAEDVKAALRERGINVSVAPRSSTLLDSEARDLPDLVRASVHYYNTEEELETLSGALREIL